MINISLVFNIGQSGYDCMVGHLSVSNVDYFGCINVRSSYLGQTADKVY